MSAAELKELRKEIKHYIDKADERVLRMLYAMFEADKQAELTPEQEAVLEKRMKEYENGITKFSSWEDAKKRITSKKRNAA
jgi:putative addiction module component (TIGR02574 family)